MKVVLNFHLGSDVRIGVPDAMLATLRRRFPALEFAPAEDRAALAREARDADVFFGFEFPPELAPNAPKLRWIQSISAGIERNLAPPIVERGIAVTNGAGIAATGIAEHVIAVMLMLCRNFHVAGRVQAECKWDRPAVMAGTGTPIREFAGCHVAILGLGPIGVAVGHHSAALGAVVRGLRRHPTGTPPAPFDAVVGGSGLHDLLGWADFVVLALPHTNETDRLIGPPELSAMGPDSYLVNVARGSVVDEDALVEALRRGAIAGAALDVVTREPLPPTSPLWRLPNVIITPHAAGATPRYFERALDLFADNLDRFVSGRPLRNLVDPGLGYPKS